METTTLIYILVSTVAVLAVVVALLVWRLFHKNDELKAKNEVIIRELRRNQTLIDRAVSLGIKRAALLTVFAAFCLVMVAAAA